jgi:alkaline phosphatase D
MACSLAQSSACGGKVKSEIGATKTAPAPGTNAVVKTATASCSRFDQGYFTAYGTMARRIKDEDIDVVRMHCSNC